MAGIGKVFSSLKYIKLCQEIILVKVLLTIVAGRPESKSGGW